MYIVNLLLNHWDLYSIFKKTLKYKKIAILKCCKNTTFIDLFRKNPDFRKNE
jgi:hypothetical protein